MARGATLALVLAAAALVAAWALAAPYLLETAVPDGLSLPQVAAADVVSAEELAEARRFERFLRTSALLSVAALLLVFGLYARYGMSFAKQSAAGRIGTGMLLAMLGFAVYWLVQIPFGLADLWWLRRHEISNVDYLTWLVESWFALGGEFLFVCLAVLIVMGLARPLPRTWWIPGGAVFVGLVLLFTFVSPYLLPGLDDAPADVVAEARGLAEEQGLPEDIPVKVEDVSEFTTAPNAYATGLGPTRVVVLWNTLLASFDDGEVRVVVAHELAHHSRDHLWKLVGWYALFAFPGVFLIALATRRRGGMAEPAAVPLALFVLVVLQLAALPLQNALSRGLEAEADWVALETTEDPEGARGLFAGFATEALVDPDPPDWAHFLLDSHPTLVDRIAMAEAWRSRRDGSP
ncbi:MAG TPA: M48 family metalloprotease [Gaiellaceae bacterium]|nr:M48 family metalloprotease [Gaiellaceae bacterium]